MTKEFMYNCKTKQSFVYNEYAFDIIYKITT